MQVSCRRFSGALICPQKPLASGSERAERGWSHRGADHAWSGSPDRMGPEASLPVLFIWVLTGSCPGPPATPASYWGEVAGPPAPSPASLPAGAEKRESLQPRGHETSQLGLGHRDSADRQDEAFGRLTQPEVAHLSPSPLRALGVGTQRGGGAPCDKVEASACLEEAMVEVGPGPGIGSGSSAPETEPSQGLQANLCPPQPLPRPLCPPPAPARLSRAGPVNSAPGTPALSADLAAPPWPGTGHLPGSPPLPGLASAPASGSLCFSPGALGGDRERTAAKPRRSPGPDPTCPQMQGNPSLGLRLVIRFLGG